MSRFINVLLDLDGTLTDPFEGIAGCIQHAMNCMGLAPLPEDELKGVIGPPLRQGFSKFLATQDTSRIENAMRFYRERYSVTGLFENRVYPGVPEMLAKLNAAGCRLFVATSKPSAFARRIIQHFDLERYFWYDSFCFSFLLLQFFFVGYGFFVQVYDGKRDSCGGVEFRRVRFRSVGGECGGGEGDGVRDLGLGRDQIGRASCRERV